MQSFSYTCPFCNKGQMATDKTVHEFAFPLHVGEIKIGMPGCKGIAIRCVNDECREVSLALQFGIGEWSGGNWYFQIPTESWQLRPESKAKPQPEYIPEAIVNDYREACLIVDKSPKASATLARRCLQGMIRDFCKISKARLIEEIAELRKMLDEDRAPRGVEAETIEAIDAVRKVGNIGAHMEKDINVIVDVDPGEAEALIDLIELLIVDWYIAKHNRTRRLAEVTRLAAEKDAAIKAAKQKSGAPQA